MDTTCQICARQIKAKSGLIAHHGYKRPGDGWQTASCMGARYRPYEVACDRIDDAIKAVAQFKADRLAWRQTLRIDPPATLTEYIAGVFIRNPRTYEKPVDFVPPTHTGAYAPHTYAGQWCRAFNACQRAIESADHDLAFFEKRLREWKPCK